MQVRWEGEGGGVGKRGAELAHHRRSGQPIPGSVATYYCTRFMDKAHVS